MNFKYTKKLCDSFLELGVPGFDLCVYKDGGGILRYMGGYSDLENKIPVNGKERYNIYSCSKPITCVAAMQLWEKGLFSLEDELGKYMPEFKEMTVKTPQGNCKAQNAILVKHLFEMTAGLIYDFNHYAPQIEEAKRETDGKCPTRKMVGYLAKAPLLFAPGTRWDYSLCHDVLAAFVEVVSGMRFEDYVAQNIFAPLDMKNTTFMLPQEERDQLACQYVFEPERKAAYNCGKGNQYLFGSEYASGGAGCVSTVEDYIKFLEALREGEQLLRRDTIRLMTTDRLNEQQYQTYWGGNTHGYGLGVRCPRNDIYRDFGWGGAAGAFLAVDVEHGFSVYYAQHLLNSPNKELRKMIYRTVCADLGYCDIQGVQEEISGLGDYKVIFPE